MSILAGSDYMLAYKYRPFLPVFFGILIVPADNYLWNDITSIRIKYNLLRSK